MEITATFIIAQIFGLLASLALIASVQFRKKAQILILMIAAYVFFVVNFVLLEAYSGAAVCAVSAAITAVIFVVEKRGRKITWPLVTVFALVEMAAVILTFEQVWDIAPAIGTGFWLASLLQRNENRLRWLLIVNFAAWIAYGVATAAYTTIIADGFSIISTVIALHRFRGEAK